MFSNILVRIKKRLILVIIQLGQNNTMIQTISCSDERWNVKRVVVLLLKKTPKMYSCLVGDSGEHKKVKNLNKNIVATISHGEYKDVLLNNKYLRHSINRIQSKKRK